MEDVLPTVAAQQAEPTEEQRARLEAWFAAHPFGDQDENGADLSLLQRNLGLTPKPPEQIANSLALCYTRGIIMPVRGAAMSKFEKSPLGVRVQKLILILQVFVALVCLVYFLRFGPEARRNPVMFALLFLLVWTARLDVGTIGWRVAITVVQLAVVISMVLTHSFEYVVVVLALIALQAGWVLVQLIRKEQRQKLIDATPVVGPDILAPAQQRIR